MLQIRKVAITAVVATASLVGFPSLNMLHAQADTYASASLPDTGKILVIVREFTKPGRDGATHEKTEAMYAATMRAAKSNDFYTGMVAMTGVPRALFLSSYSSLADLEAKRNAMPASANAALDVANLADAASLESTSTAYFTRRDSLSTNVKAPPAHARYMEIAAMTVKAGHEHEFEEAAALYLKDMVKAAPATHYTCYSSIYGPENGTVYLFLTALTSLAEADAEQTDGDKFGMTTSPRDLKALADALSTSVLVSTSHLYRLSPKMSYPGPAQIAGDPAFWKPAATKSAPKSAPKPAQ